MGFLDSPEKSGVAQTELSIPPPAYGPSSAFAALILARSDRIRLLSFPGEIDGVVDEAIRRVWVPGIQKREQGEWKLSGRPCESLGFSTVKLEHD